MKNFTLHTCTALLAAAALTACGGGGGTTAPSASSSVVSQGVITAKGSVFVNGIEYSTVGAAIRIDDNPGTESQLHEGMVVKVRGTKDDTTRKGQALEIEARDALEGTIDNNGVDAVNHTITVMGQTVRIEDNVTRLNDDSVQKVFADAAFQPGDLVEVHGYADDQGGLRATRVLRKATGEFEAKGFVTSLGASSFGLALTPGGAAVVTVNFSSLPGGVANGSFVQVKSAAAPVAGAVTATLIHLEDRIGVAGDKVEVEGIVSGGTVDDFIINGKQVVTTASTLFEGGLKSDFAVGMKLEAEGPLNAGGAIVAAKISFRGAIKLEADASGVSASGLTLLGKSVAIAAGITRIDNGPITNGSHLEVRASIDRNGNLTAERIIVQSASTRAFLQAPVTAFDAAAGTMTILGTAIVTDGNTEYRVSSTSSDTAVAKATFFAQLTANVTIVKVRWDSFTATSAPVKQAEIQLGK